MELRHLRSFVAIAEERSFTHAAERLRVAQPGLSTQIRRELFLERARTAPAAADAARSTGHDLEEGLVAP
jgi:hypothetical protein